MPPAVCLQGLSRIPYHMAETHSSEHSHTRERAHGHGDGSQHGRGGIFPVAAHATAHCLVGCFIGEVLGVVIGALIGWGALGRMGLGTALAFVFGLNLAALPLVRSQGMTFFRALRTIFWGEVASIAAMEIAMNGADYLFGGAQAAITDWRFWAGFLVMLPAGYLAALPVNYLLIKFAVKDPCHH